MFTILCLCFILVDFEISAHTFMYYSLNVFNLNSLDNCIIIETSNIIDLP